MRNGDKFQTLKLLKKIYLGENYNELSSRYDQMKYGPQELSEVS